MEFFRTNTDIPFMRQRIAAAVFSVFVFIASITSLVVNGLNLGLDFTGGTQVDVSYTSPVNINLIRSELREAGFPQATVVPFNSRELSVRIGVLPSENNDHLKARLISALPGATIGSLSYIGPQVGKQLMTNGILAIVVSLIGTMAYIAMRFEYRFALSAAIALIHDPVLILGIFSYLHMEFNMIVLTAVLTVIGYSLNDTIVVYDRIRENFHKVRKKSPSEIVDLSINQTLSRTIMTSGLTLLVVIALFVYGGEMIHGFSLALIIGILIGTYSSIYIAGSVAISFGMSRQSLLPRARTTADELP